jgi:pimeloyl-ACP methyl ester carboxylesterase
MMPGAALHAHRVEAARPVGNPAEKVVFLHGFAGEGAQWLPIMAALGEHGTASVAFDLPGHAGSLAYPEAGAVKVAAQAVLAELATFGQPVHLVGHSMGGAVAGLIALFAPHAVASLIFLSPGGFGADINAPALRGFAKAATLPDLSAALGPFFAAGFAPGSSRLASMLAMRQKPGQLAMLEWICGNLVREDGTQGTLPLAKIAAIGKPMHVIWGTEDQIVPVAQADALPGASTTLLPGIGHMLHEEAPQEIVKSVLRQTGTGGVLASKTTL